MLLPPSIFFLFPHNGLPFAYLFIELAAVGVETGKQSVLALTHGSFKEGSGASRTCIV